MIEFLKGYIDGIKEDADIIEFMPAPMKHDYKLSVEVASLPQANAKDNLLAEQKA